MDQDAQLGQLQETFRPKSSEMIACFFVAGVLVVGGIALGIVGVTWLFAETEDESRTLNAALILMAVGFLAAPIAGYLCFAKGKSLKGTATAVYEHGFIRTSSRDAKVCHWEDIQQIVETIQVKKMAVLEHGLATTSIRDRSLRVICQDGQFYVFDLSNTKGLRRLIEHLKTASKQHNIPWKNENKKG